MKVRMDCVMGIAAGSLLLTGSLALGQAATGGKTASTNKTDVVQTASINNGTATERQDQFGHASGKQTTAAATPVTDGRSLDSAHASDASQRKHLAGVKYEDRTAASPGTAASGEPSKMAITEQGFAKPTKPAKPQQ